MIKINLLRQIAPKFTVQERQLIELRAEGKTAPECAKAIGRCRRWVFYKLARPEIQEEIDRLSEVRDITLKEERIRIAKLLLARQLHTSRLRTDPLAVLEYIAKETGGLQPEQQFVFVNIIEEASRIRERIGGSLGNPDISPELVRNIGAGLRSLDKTGRDSRKRKIKQEDGS